MERNRYSLRHKTTGHESEPLERFEGNPSDLLDDGGKILLANGILRVDERYGQLRFHSTAPTLVIVQNRTPMPTLEVLGVVYTPTATGAYVLDSPKWKGPLPQDLRAEFMNQLVQLISQIEGNYDNSRLQPLKNVTKKMHDEKMKLLDDAGSFGAL